MQDQVAVSEPSARMTKMAVIIIAFSGLGGLLYGFDIGVISGALVFMKPDLGISATQASLIVAAVLGGGAVANFVSGPFADRYGRRFSINISACVFIVGVVILLVANSFTSVMVGRFIEGFGIGIITIVVPLYMAETIPAYFRGRGIALFQLCLTFGILLGYAINYGLKSSGDWRLMFGTALVPGVLFLIGGLTVLPRSPRWLYVKGLLDEARDVLVKTHGPGVDVTALLDEIKRVIEEEARLASNSWSLLFRRGYRKAFFIAFAVGVLTQLTGINVLLQYNAVILGASGLHTAILGSVGVGVINFLFTLLAVILVDKVGRKPLLIIGTAGVTASLVFIGVIHLAAPTSLSAGYATMIGFMAFVAFYAVGPGVVVWLAISETMPMAIRARGMSIALCANSLASAGLAAVFADIVGWIGYSGMFFALACCTFLYLLVAIFPLPETKGRSLEDIEEALFAGVETE